MSKEKFYPFLLHLDTFEGGLTIVFSEDERFRLRHGLVTMKEVVAEHLDKHRF